MSSLSVYGMYFSSIEWTKMRLAIMMAVQSAVAALQLFAPVCSSWTRISRGTSWRTSINVFGDLSSSWVRDANTMLSRPGRTAIYTFIFFKDLNVDFQTIIPAILCSLQAGSLALDMPGNSQHFLGGAAGGVEGCVPTPPQVQLVYQSNLHGAFSEISRLGIPPYYSWGYDGFALPFPFPFPVLPAGILRSTAIRFGCFIMEANLLRGRAFGQTGGSWLPNLPLSELSKNWVANICLAHFSPTNSKNRCLWIA